MAIKSIKNGKYVSVNLVKQSAMANGNHPIIYGNSPDLPRNEEFTILKFDNRDFRGVISFGQAVCFQTK